MLTQCSASTANAPIQIDLASELAEPCDLPAKLPDGDLTQAQVEDLWETDRGALINCGNKVGALQNIIVTISN